MACLRGASGGGCIWLCGCSMINAYLSYRHRNETAILARDELESCCEKSGLITLIYDKKATKEDDSLICFMEKLVDARCLFLFLEPDYFESSYTLFELICINEQEGLDKGFVHPIRLTESMVTYTRTSARQFWQANLAIREETARLLKKTGRLKDTKDDDYDAIWRRIDNAWSNLIEDCLDHLKSAVTEDGKPNTRLQIAVKHVIPAIEEVRNQKQVSLLAAMNKQIVGILNKKSIPLKAFSKELGEYDSEGELTEDAISIASFLTRRDSAVKIRHFLNALICVVDDEKDRLGIESDEWEDCFNDAEQLAGWLLLRSIDADWWFDNEHSIQSKTEKSTLDKLSLDSIGFVEVVISRGVLQAARYRINEHGEAEPYNKKHNILMLYDASDEAKKTQFLRDIYIDIYRRNPDSKLSSDELFEKIIIRAKSSKDIAKGKAIYYLVSEETQKLLETFDWYKQPKASFEGCLHFICCNAPDKDYEKSVSSEDQNALLDRIAILLALNED